MPADTRNLVVPYLGVVAVPLLALVWILHSGGPAGAPARMSSRTPAQIAGGAPNLAMLMAQIGLIILVSRGLGALLEKLRQPRVIGEMLAGILLGPSLLGWAMPGFSAWLFPAQGFAVLNALSQLGLVLFMFMVGLEMDLGEVYRQRRLAVLMSHASIAAPMTLGAASAVFLYPRMSDATVGFSGFALFIGVAMSITAFPVLARILSERRLVGTKLGSLAIACAAVDDVTGWCVLAYVVGMARASHARTSLWLPLAGLPVFLAAMFWGTRRLLRRVEREYEARQSLSNDWKAMVLVLLLASALSTEMLGLHLLFGAFVLGAVMPKHAGLAAYIVGKFEALTVLLLLPLFFAYTGLRTRLGEIHGAGNWAICVLIIGVAVLGKVGGAGAAARLGGLGWRESLAIGALMNTRGLMELVVLNIGLDVGLISPALFTMMVVMAIVTTTMAPPLLERVYPGARWARAEVKAA